MFTTGIFSQKTFEGLEKNEWIKENLRKDIKVQNEQTRVNNSTISNERTRIRFNPVKVCKDAKTHQTHWREGGIIKGKMEIFWLQSSSALRYAPTTAAACHWCSRVCVCVWVFFFPPSIPLSIFIYFVQCLCKAWTICLSLWGRVGGARRRSVCSVKAFTLWRPSRVDWARWRGGRRRRRKKRSSDKRHQCETAGIKLDQIPGRIHVGEQLHPHQARTTQ